jgi:SAM-dependent methyltransferase
MVLVQRVSWWSDGVSMYGVYHGTYVLVNHSEAAYIPMPEGRGFTRPLITQYIDSIRNAFRNVSQMGTGYALQQEKRTSQNALEDRMNLHERDASVEELLDASGVDEQLLEGSLRDLRRLGSLLGWTRQAVKDVARLVREQHLSDVSILDVGTGAANVPIALAQWARRQQLQAQITACDINEQMLAVARANCLNFPAIHLEQQNALALTYADQSFDLVLCQGVLHHFPPDEAQALLRELARVTRRALIVTDLQRNLPLYLGGWLLMHTLVRNPITRHDGLASIRRAYTPGEVRALAEQAGLRSAATHTALRLLQSLIWQR